MILEGLLTVVKFLITTLFGVINIPGLPEGIQNSIDYFFDLLFGGVQFLGFIVHWLVVKVLRPLLLAILVAENAYYVIMWIIRKLPFLGMS